MSEAIISVAQIFSNPQSTIIGRRYYQSLRLWPKFRFRRTKLRNQAMDPSHHLADFEPTFWGDHFLSYTPQQTEISTQEKLEVDELKVIMRKTLVETPKSSTEKLVLIDTIQRLGVAYHFDNEIEISIQNIFDSQLQNVFKQFMDHNRNFKETLINNDVQGLLSLYEASHMRMHDEEIIEEALIFTTTRLESMLPNFTNNSLKVQVIEALRQPIRKTVPRVGARKYTHL
ncbi:hypothetical protein H5410_032494 [Solanum commersonii]|uniref:Terpene synthase N-terminal domain-containing protein n=1 Tax=Solanum commersonii TaxID=4109 RepID=A0A9J5YPT5_SOLCO|nr:hypothetical protein H5410_032494 [Solanum commersonii]